MPEAPVEAGDFRYEVTFQEPVETPESDFNETQITWRDVATRVVAIKHLTGNEMFVSGQTESVATHRIIAREIPGVVVDPRFQIKFEVPGTIPRRVRIFNIVSVDDVYFDSTLVMLAKERT